MCVCTYMCTYTYTQIDVEKIKFINDEGIQSKSVFRIIMIIKYLPSLKGTVSKSAQSRHSQANGQGKKV